jgi:hypothetical protein
MSSSDPINDLIDKYRLRDIMVDSYKSFLKLERFNHLDEVKFEVYSDYRTLPRDLSQDIDNTQVKLHNLIQTISTNNHLDIKDFINVKTTKVHVVNNTNVDDSKINLSKATPAIERYFNVLAAISDLKAHPFNYTGAPRRDYERLDAPDLESDFTEMLTSEIERVARKKEELAAALGNISGSQNLHDTLMLADAKEKAKDAEQRVKAAQRTLETNNAKRRGTGGRKNKRKSRRVASKKRRHKRSIRSRK